jgi:hypothetical protein
MKTEVIIFSLLLFGGVLSFVSAGVGIKWEQESFLVNSGEKTCLTYSVYNPWPEDSSVQIELPENLKNLLTSQEAETKLIPANTASTAAIPVKFCFEVPQVYSKECLIGDIICKQECKEEQIVYEGEVSVKSVPGNAAISGSGGSATQMSVSAPLKIKVVCNPHGLDFSIVYITLIIISIVAILIILYLKQRKPDKQKKEEKLEQLRKEMKRLKGRK